MFPGNDDHVRRPALIMRAPAAGPHDEGALTRPLTQRPSDCKRIGEDLIRARRGAATKPSRRQPQWQLACATCAPVGRGIVLHVRKVDKSSWPVRDVANNLLLLLLLLLLPPPPAPCWSGQSNE